MNVRDWVIGSVFILLHLAAAIIRGVPVELVLLGALLMLVAMIVFIRRYQLIDE